MAARTGSVLTLPPDAARIDVISIQHERKLNAGPALVLLPMALAIVGAVLDERRNLGFSTWRSACRAAGLSLSSLFTFTLELLPAAVIGALAGGVLLQVLGVCLRHKQGLASASLAAHGGCSLGMLAGLPLCALPLPIPLLLGVELLLAVLAAGLLHRCLAVGRSCAHQGPYLSGADPVRSKAYIRTPWQRRKFPRVSTSAD